MKELAVNATNPHLYTIATLTGHAVVTVGTNYSIGKCFTIYFCILKISNASGKYLPISNRIWT